MAERARAREIRIAGSSPSRVLCSLLVRVREKTQIGIERKRQWKCKDGTGLVRPTRPLPATERTDPVDFLPPSLIFGIASWS